MFLTSGKYIVSEQQNLFPQHTFPPRLNWETFASATVFLQFSQALINHFKYWEFFSRQACAFFLIFYSPHFTCANVFFNSGRLHDFFSKSPPSPSRVKRSSFNCQSNFFDSCYLGHHATLLRRQALLDHTFPQSTVVLVFGRSLRSPSTIYKCQKRKIYYHFHFNIHLQLKEGNFLTVRHVRH